MAKVEHSEKLDLSKLDVRARNVLRRFGVDTAEKLLRLDEQKVLAARNCGDKTLAKIITLQQRYGKVTASVKNKHQSAGKAIPGNREHINELIAVAMAANALVEGKNKSDRYHVSVTKQKFNVLSRCLQELRKPRQ